MQNGGASETGTVSKEIRFDCPHCSAPLVVPAGSTIKSLDCKRCRKSVRIPRTVLSTVTRSAAPTSTPSPTRPAPAAVLPPIKATPTHIPPVTPTPASRPTTPSPATVSPPPVESAVTPPPPATAAANISLTLEELKRQLKENQSQRTETTGQINQLNIQLHRLQIRINTLNERQKALEAQIASSEKPG